MNMEKNRQPMYLLQEGMTRSEVAPEFPVNSNYILAEHNITCTVELIFYTHLLSMPAGSWAGTSHGMRLDGTLVSALPSQSQGFFNMNERH